MVAVPDTAGVHWKTSSGELPELPQLPACELVPLVVPPKVPPWAGITVGLLQVPDPASVVVVVEVVVGAGLPFGACGRYGPIGPLPGSTEPGRPPVRPPATTSSPAGIAAVGPVLA